MEYFLLLFLCIKDHHGECDHKKAHLPYSPYGILWQPKHRSED